LADLQILLGAHEAFLIPFRMATPAEDAEMELESFDGKSEFEILMITSLQPKCHITEVNPDSGRGKGT
jgi:hypothetical protein